MNALHIPFIAVDQCVLTLWCGIDFYFADYDLLCSFIFPLFEL